MRYWCTEHKADATAKYGIAAPRCANADQTPLAENEILSINIDEFEGGTAFWGAVPAVYDTTRLPMDSGIHVHARRKTGGNKEIDSTFSAIRVHSMALPEDGILISELESIYYMVASVFGFKTKLVLCTYCGYAHLDKDFFAVHPHRRHLCAGCGKHFYDSERGVGNPISSAQAASGFAARKPKPAGRKLKISQRDYPGGIQIWGSNTSLLWTSKAREEEGIHVHAHKTTNGYEVDDTFSSVTIDGVKLDPVKVRVLMAQRSLPSIAGRIVALRCQGCGTEYFDPGEQAFTPSDTHICVKCGSPVKAKHRFRKVVSNPIIEALIRLELTAVRPPQEHSLMLRPETL